MDKKDNNSYQLIESKAELENIIMAFGEVKRIAVDLEADSMFHFTEKVCLIQMATRDKTIVIDPLLIDDLSPLKPIFANNKIQKIFHGGDYDVRSLFRDFNIEINNLFDTELASRFLGVRETGLGAVLSERFGVKLDKKYQKKDWSQRPLPEGMIEYGAKDVVYLHELSKQLQEELEEKGRIVWVEEECELLSRVRCNPDSGKPLFMKVKGAGRLDSRSLAILEELLQLRVELARKKDKPLFKVMGNTVLLKIVKGRPDTTEKLKKMKILSNKQISMYGDSIISTLKKGIEIPASDLPVYPRRPAPPVKPCVPKKVAAIKLWRDRIAEKLEIDPPLLLNKALMTSIAVTNPDNVESLKRIDGMKHWQRREFGESIIKALKTAG